MSDQVPPTGPNDPNSVTNPAGPENSNFGSMSHAQSTLGPNTGLWIALSSVMLVVSVLCSCCSLPMLAIPLAIAAFVFAIQASNASKEHRFADSERKLKNAKLLTAIAAGVFVLAWIGGGIMGFATTDWDRLTNDVKQRMQEATSTTVYDSEEPTVTTSPVVPAAPTTAAQ